MGNLPIYVVSDPARRELKKKYNDLKRSIRYWHYYEDLCEVYGSPAAPEGRYERVVAEKEQIEKLLNEKL